MAHDVHTCSEPEAPYICFMSIRNEVRGLSYTTQQSSFHCPSSFAFTQSKSLKSSHSTLISISRVHSFGESTASQSHTATLLNYCSQNSVENCDRVQYDGDHTIFRGNRCPDASRSKETTNQQYCRWDGQDQTFSVIRRGTGFAHDL